MLKEILWLLAGYLAIIGLVRVVAVLVDLIAPPAEKRAGCPAPCCCRRRRRHGRSAGGTAGTGILILWICPRQKNGV